MLESLVSLDETHYEAYKLLGDVLKKDGDMEESVLHYMKAIEINQNYEKAYLAIGQIYSADSSQDDKALEYLEHAIDIKPAYPKAYETIGFIYQRSADAGNSKDYTKAIYYYDKTLEYDRRNYKVMARLSSVYNNLENYDLAKKYAKEVILMPIMS